ncbi:unnamed protein product, partial [Adineta ricciae]
MDRNESNDLTGTSVMLPLATIEEDIDEIDTITDDNENHLLETNFMTITTNDANPLHTHQSNNEISTEPVTSTIQHYPPNDFRDESCSTNTTIVPFIVVTHDETGTIMQSETSTIGTPSRSPVNMDNISLKDYYSPTSCPGSPILSRKLLLSRSTASTLSPPGVPLTASSTSLASAGKRRGLGLASAQRASHKRAHTGRSSLDHTPNELFIELQELKEVSANEYQWHECARWIRYEEDYDFEMERWQAPRIGCLNFHSLLELRRGLQYGIVLLDLEEQKLECIYEAILNDAIANGQMNKDVKDEILRRLTSVHKHPEARSYRRRSSTVDCPPASSGRRSSLAFRKNEQINLEANNRRMSLLDSKANGELKNLRNLVVKYENTEEVITADSQPKKYLPEQADSGTDYNSNDSVNQAPRLSVTQGVFIQRQVQGSGKKNRDSNPYKSDVMRCVSEHAECAEVLIGSIRSLTRPIMAFVRLSHGQLIDDITEVPLPLRFLFLLVGPAMEEYLEIGRALSTLFSTLDFREAAYQAMDRRDLLHGINDFLSDSIVLPPGDFDKELLLPIIETNKMKKMNIKRRSTRLQSQHIDRLHDTEHQ